MSAMFNRPKLSWWLPIVGIPVVVMGGLFGIGVYRDTHPESEVTRLWRVLELKPGMAIAEIGAGEGKMTVSMARQLGPGGRVVATEVDPARLRDIERAVAKAGLQNVRIIRGGDRATNLAERCCDAIFMARVYHHFTDPVAMDASLFQALRPGGHLAVIDFAPSRWRFWLRQPSGVPADRGGHGMPKEILIQELTRAGFQVERIVDDWWRFPGTRYCVVFRKPGAD